MSSALVIVVSALVKLGLTTRRKSRGEQFGATTASELALALHLRESLLLERNKVWLDGVRLTRAAYFSLYNNNNNNNITSWRI